jgi:hypothetical protein
MNIEHGDRCRCHSGYSGRLAKAERPDAGEAFSHLSRKAGNRLIVETSWNLTLLQGPDSVNVSLLLSNVALVAEFSPNCIELFI